MRLARITALIMLMALSGCAILRPTQKPTQQPAQKPTINQAAQQIVASTGAIIARAAPHRYGLTYGATYGATGGSEVGSFPNAAPFGGSERILMDQNGNTVNGTPAQMAQYLGLPVGLSFPLSVANGGTGTSSPGLIAGTNVTITGAWPDQTINSGASMVYPGAGIANSTGTAWSTSITTLAGLDSVLGITGTPSSTTYLRGDGTWATPSGSGTVNSGTAGQVGCYAATGTAISGCATTGSGSTVPLSVSPTLTTPILSGYATASLPTCNSASKGSLAYTTDGTPAFTFCNGSTWTSTGGTTFTVAGTGCTPTAVTGDATGGSFTLAAGPCTAVTVTFNGAVGMTAPHMWVCAVSDQTLQAAGTWFGTWGQSASTTTTATIPIPPAAGATDVVTFACSAH